MAQGSSKAVEAVRAVHLPVTDPHEMADALEHGQILFFPKTPFRVEPHERDILLGARQTRGAHHKNIAFRPGTERISGLDSVEPECRATVERVLKGYSDWAVRFAAELLPQYSATWRIDYASFRPLEEQGRELPWKKRNDLLHVDAFPSRPTHGDLILRLFTNVSPEKERVWVTSDPFAPTAEHYAADAGLSRYAAQSVSPVWKARDAVIRIARRAGIPVADRSPYDRFMLAFHDYLKASSEFQQSCPKYRTSFPPDSTWMVFTDVVPHSVLSGQHALEQTFIVSRHSLSSPERAPVSILERISGARLADL